MKKLVLLIFLIPVITFSQSTTQGLVGHWKFNGNANDDSGNSSNGIVNGPVLTEDRHGALNKAYLFNGTTGKIDCGTNAALSFSQ